MALQAFQPGDAVSVAALHLHDMGHCMRAPKVGGVDLDSLAAGRLGAGIIAGLLAGEAQAAQHRAVSRLLAAPFRQRALGRSQHVGGAAIPEIDVVGEPERQDVGRMRVEDLLAGFAACA